MPENRLEELREEMGLSITALAKEIGVDRSTISRWERSLVGIPDPRKQQLAEFFAVSVPFLMAWDEPNDNGNGEQAAA